MSLRIAAVVPEGDAHHQDQANAPPAATASTVKTALKTEARAQSVNKRATSNHSLLIIKNTPMGQYRISGVWKNNQNVITHYAIHTVINATTTSKANKASKEDAVALLDKQGNTAYTWIWNYQNAGWTIGEKVEVINGENGKYLRSNPDHKLTDNLSHLIDYNWIAS